MEKLDKQRVTFWNPGYWLRFWPKDISLRVVSLVLATILWYYVGGEDTVNKTVLIPVEIINLPADLVLTQPKKELEVTVTGPQSVILKMQSREFSYQIDLSSARPGTTVKEISNDSIPVARGVKVQRVQPASIILSLDKLIQRQFPIKPVTTGSVTSDYLLKEIQIQPSHITLSGPQAVLSQVHDLRTEAINLSGLQGNVQQQVPLDLEPDIVELMGETSVTAEIVIIPETILKKINQLEVLVVIDGKPQKIVPSTVSVTATIPKPLLRNTADLRSLFSVTAVDESGDGQWRVGVEPVKGLQGTIGILKIIPATVSLIKEPVLQKPVIPENDNSAVIEPSVPVAPAPDKSVKTPSAVNAGTAAQ